MENAVERGLNWAGMQAIATAEWHLSPGVMGPQAVTPSRGGSRSRGVAIISIPATGAPGLLVARQMSEVDLALALWTNRSSQGLTPCARITSCVIRLTSCRAK